MKADQPAPVCTIVALRWLHHKTTSCCDPPLSLLLSLGHGHWKGYDGCPNSHHGFNGHFVQNNSMTDNEVVQHLDSHVIFPLK